MSIVQGELKLYKSAVVNDTGSNGGRMSAVEAVDAVKNNVFPDLSVSERTAGLTRWRKLFVKVANAAGLALQNPKIIIETVTPGADHVEIAAGTFEDTQSGLGTPRLYGGGQLNANVSATATSIDVLVEDAAAGLFADGDTIRISDRATVDGAGNEEFMVIAASGVSYLGNVATLTLTSGLANGYTASATRVSSVYQPADIVGAVSNWVETAAGSGTYDEVGSPVAVDSIGGVSQAWTLTFSSGTAFSVVGDTLGNVGSGTTAGDFAPNNPDFTAPYFTLLAAGWAGTWASGDTITFRTDPAAAPIWLKQTVPAGTAALSSDSVIPAIIGESA